MSKQVHCPECQSENTPGSKFCNSCGARLPKSTSVLCPRCQNPNPHTNFYCDNCGGRLHAEQTPPPEEEAKQEASDLPTSAKMFTLPTRDPGDTGDLDPASLPEWLKTQGDHAESSGGTGKLPRLSDLTPEKRNTAEDLPGWLISTENEDLLIDSPDDITTEHFLHLIQDIDEEEREKLSGLLNHPSIAGDAANLPDWLKSVAQPTTTETPKSSVEEPESADIVDEDGMDWLFESTTEDDSAQSTAKTPVAQEETSPQDPDELPDWLGELGPPRTALLGRLGEDDAPSSESEIDESEDFTDWLTGETDSQEVGSQDTNDIFSEAYSFEDDVPDWMLGDGQLEDTPQGESPLPQETVDDLTLDAVASTSSTGWLAEFDTDDGDTEGDDVDSNVEETAVSPEEAPAPDNVETRRSLTDWLTAFDEEDLDPTDEPSELIQPEEEAEEPLPGWLTGIDEAVSAAAVIGKATDDADPVDDDSFNWLSDFDELAEDAPVVDTAAKTEDDLADVLDLDISTDTSLAAGNTGLLPDWLDDLEPATETSSQFDSDELGDSLDDLFGAVPKDTTGELKWLEEIGEDEIESEPDSAPLMGAIGAAALIGASNQDDDATVDDNPDWLSELADFDLNEGAEEDVSETAVSELFPELATEDEDDFDIEAIFETTESAKLDEFDIDDALLGVGEQTVGDWADIDGILSGAADDEALPDWLAQLDDAPEIAVIESDEEPSDEIPAWVANLRPGEMDELASVLPSALFTESDTSDLLSDPTDLADADLPDWLDATIDGSITAAEKGSSGWFDSEDLEDAPAELEALLADLPPAQAPEDMLQKAEIPAWLEELKPRELTGEPLPITESRLESSGPLAGMPNTIAVEPIIAMPRVASTPSLYTISPGQAQQALLLRQLVQEDPQRPAADAATLSARGVAGLRILVAILLLVTVILGLYGPDAFKSKVPTTVPAPAVAMNTAVSNAAGKTVLIAFEYTPALAGELNHEAEMLLAQLNANGSRILTTSQYVAGTAVSEAITTPYDIIPLGLIPGEAIGLRQLGSCLGEGALASPCTSLHTRTLSDDMSNTLADVGLIIVLTGERNSLVNWVEQVGTSSTVPIVIGATQALEPVVVPYYASAQVAGYLNGLPATVAYQQAYMQLTDSPAETQYGALSLVYWVTAVILLIGGLAFGFKKKKS